METNTTIWINIHLLYRIDILLKVEILMKTNYLILNNNIQYGDIFNITYNKNTVNHCCHTW